MATTKISCRFTQQPQVVAGGVLAHFAIERVEVASDGARITDERGKTKGRLLFEGARFFPGATLATVEALVRAAAVEMHERVVTAAAPPGAPPVGVYFDAAATSRVEIP